MRVLFVSGIDGFCLRYQVLHRAAQVAALGGRATVRHFADPRLADEAAASDVVWLYRVPDTAWIASVVARARAAGRPIVGSIDDLIFIPDEGLFPGMADWSEDARELWLDGVRRYRAALERCDAVVLPTAALCAEARAAGLPAMLHRNSASDAELALGRAARALRRRESGAPLVVGYASGTPTHDRDLAVAAPALADLLRERPDVRLRLIGPVDPGPQLAALADRVERRDLVPWWRLPDEIAACDVCIAPLALERFGAAKGEVKYLEAAAASVPLVASPSGAFLEAIRPGENGVLAATADAWHRALSGLLADAGLRQRIGDAARADVERRFSDAVRAPELAEVLAAAVRAGPGTGAVAPSRCRADREPRLARVALEGDGYPGALDGAAPDAESPPVAAGHSIAQRVRASCDGLARIDVHTVTYGLRVSGVVELECAAIEADGRRTMVAADRIPAEEVPDRGWLALEIEPRLASAARERREWEVTLRLDAADPASALRLGTAASEGKGLRLDGVPIAGRRLALRGFASWGAAGREDTAAPREGAAAR